METKKKIQKLTEQIKELRIQRTQLQKKLVDENELKVGDKVIVEHLGWNKKPIIDVAFIAHIGANDEGEMYFKFNQAKKDGTKSMRSLYVSTLIIVKKF